MQTTTPKKIILHLKALYIRGIMPGSMKIIAAQNIIQTIHGRPATALLVFGILYYLSYFNYGLDLDDEGLLLIGAQSILHGDWPVADFFSYPPISYFLLAGFYKVFGDGVLSERILLLLLLLANAQLVFWISRQFLNGAWKLLPAFTYILAPGPWYKLFFISAIIWSTSALILYIYNPSLRRAFLLGLTTSIALLTRHQAGIIALILSFLGLSTLTIRHKLTHTNVPWRLLGTHTIGLLSGMTLPILMTALAYSLAGKWTDLLLHIKLYYLERETIKVINKLGILTVFSPASFLSRPTLEQSFYAAGLLATVGLLLRSVRAFLSYRGIHQQRAHLCIILAVAALGSLSYSYLFVWNSRMLSTFPLVYIIWALIIERLYYQLRQKSPLLAILATIIAVGMIATPIAIFTKIQNYSGSLTTRIAQMTTIDHPLLQHIHVYEMQQKDITRLRSLLDKYHVKYLVSMSESTTMSYLSGLPNPTYYRPFTVEFGAPGEPARLLRTIEELCIDAFVARRSQFLPGGGLGSNLRQYAPKVRQHLLSHYRIEPLGEGFVLLIRNTDCNKGSI